MKPILFCAAFAGLAGVALGAFGAHVLRETFAARGTEHIWATAVQYQLVHAVAAFALGLWSVGRPRSGPWVWAGRFWLVGIALFSGSLYWLALGGPKWLGPVTPLGGLLFMAGWVCVMIGAAKLPSDRSAG